MIVEHKFGHVLIEATGAEVDAVYRVYLRAYGPRDGATQDVYRALLQRADFREEVPPEGYLSLANGFYEERWDEPWRVLTRAAAWEDAEQLREKAEALEAEARDIEDKAHRETRPRQRIRL